MIRIICISDTHGSHRRLGEAVPLPAGDILVHTGDFTSAFNRKDDGSDFLDWFASQPHAHKIFIAGNHDWSCYYSKLPPLPTGVTYLEDSWCLAMGLKVYGSPWTPYYHNWYYSFPPSNCADTRRLKWSAIPADTDVLLTHGPPSGVLEWTEDGKRIGDHELLKAVNRVRPRLHVFGHNHNAFGACKLLKGTMCVNASQVDEKYRFVNCPVTADLSDTGRFDVTIKGPHEA